MATSFPDFDENFQNSALVFNKKWHPARRNFVFLVYTVTEEQYRISFYFSLYIRNIQKGKTEKCLSQWPRGLRRAPAAARLLRLWVRIPQGGWMIVSCECCVMSGRGLCDELIIRPEELYRLRCVVVCDLETS
jgi:hypothetical protein